MAAGRPLDAAETAAAMRAVRLWQQKRPADEVKCPRCAAGGLSVVDRSARPFAEWYKLDCAACGLAHTLGVAMAPPAHD